MPDAPLPLDDLLRDALERLASELSAGEPAWMRRVRAQPVWAASGRAIRGLAALLLWQAEKPGPFAGAWQRWEGAGTPVIVPLRGRRAWTPVSLVASPRRTPRPTAFPDWAEEEPLRAQITALRLAERVDLATSQPVIEALAGLFFAALRRTAPPGWPVGLQITAEALPAAAALAALIADAAFAKGVGRFFRDAAALEPSCTDALFPVEAWEGKTTELDRSLRRGRRFLSHGKGVAQLPMQRRGHIRLDRIFEKGQVVPGAARVLAGLEALALPITGDPALDARRLGRALAARMQKMEEPPAFLEPGAAKAWTQLRRKVRYRAWHHHLDHLHLGDLIGARERFRPRDLIIQSYAATVGLEVARTQVPLAAVGLMRLLIALAPPRALEPCEAGALLRTLGGPVPREYRRHPIAKEGGGRRWLDVPTPRLAALQRKLVAELRPRTPSTGVATAFEPGRAPAHHARMHQGAAAAVVVDITDFFGSIRPRHLRWAFCPRPERAHRALRLEGETVDREALMEQLFAGEGRHRWLPQGAPSSPWAANLAAQPMDRRLTVWARQREGVRYSRYADDLVLSLQEPADQDAVAAFLAEAEAALRAAVGLQGWQVNEAKTRRWRAADRAPLTICGVEVPRDEGPCGLPRNVARRARAALHHLRQGEPKSEHGILAWARGATGAVGWMAWSSPLLQRVCVELAGSVLGESVMAGWADAVDLPGGEE